MLTYQEVKTLLEYGHKVWVKNKDGFFALFYGVDYNGNILRTDWNSKSIVSNFGVNYFNEKEFNEKSKGINWEIDSYVTRKIMPVGTKVKLLPTIKETYDWKVYKKDYPDMIGETVEAYNSVSGLYYIVSGRGGKEWSIGAEFLVPVEDSDKKEWLAEGKKKGYI